MIIPFLFKIDGTPVRVFDAGRGNAIVLLHGFGLHSEIWEFVFQELAEDFRVISIDLPGHGDTGLFPGMHTIDGMSSWLNKVIREIDLDKFTLVGHSLGGYIALNYTEKFPEKIQALCMFHSIATNDTPARLDYRNKTIRFLERVGVHPFLKEFFPSLYKSMHPEVLERFLEMTTVEPQLEAMIAMTEAMRDRPDMTRVLEELRIPVMYIIGGQDDLIPKNVARAELMTAKNGTIVLLDEAGHLGMLEDPLKTVSGLRSLLEIVKRT